MELLYQNLESLEDSTFKCLHIQRKHHLVPLHYHPEIEIMYNMQGIGTRVVGNSVESYDKGDFVLVGSNTPHVWKSAPEYFQDNDLTVESLVLFIPDQLPLFSLKECASIKALLEESKKGIRFPDGMLPVLHELMIGIINAHGLSRVLKVLQLLEVLSSVKDIRYLTSPDVSIDHDTRDFNRLSRCIDYLLVNYDKKIELKVIADLANLTPNSFCRYFKQRTTKTFSQYLTELRINKAARLLVDSELSIHQVAFNCGFNSLSNFNQHFRDIKGASPRDFRRQFHQVIL